MLKTFILLAIPIISTGNTRIITELRHAMRFDTNMPTVYVAKDLGDSQIPKNIFSLEHIYPQSMLNHKHSNDMHNVVRTMDVFNNCRSNYAYTEQIDGKLCTKLSFGNFVNHKKKLFVPNESSRGFIARALLYMQKEYGYDYSKLIKKETLSKWFYAYPPSTDEKYHNAMVHSFQYTNNDFISKYKSKQTRTYVNNL